MQKAPINFCIVAKLRIKKAVAGYEATAYKKNELKNSNYKINYFKIFI